MISLRGLKMKRVRNLLTTREEMKKVRESLENKTATALADFVKNRRLPPNVILDEFEVQEVIKWT